jgi:tetratricopeptide (TPR) repeat protein
LLLPFLLTALGISQTVADLNAAFSHGNFQEVVRLADSMLERNPENPRLWTARGAAQARLQQNSESLASFRKALEFLPNYIPALQGAAQVAYSQHDPSAPDLLRRIIAQDPGNSTAHAMLGALATESRDCRTAVSEFTQAMPVVQQNAAALLQYGDCLLAVDQAGAAAQIFRDLVVLKPVNPVAKYKLALSLRHTDQVAEAIELLKTIPPDSKVLNLLGECYVIRKDPESARTVLREAIQLAPTDEQNYVDLGILYIEQKQPQSAVEVTNRGLHLLPASARLYAIRGAAHTWLNDPEHAAEDFDKAELLEPEQLYGSVGISMLLRQNEHLPEAIKILRDKIAEQPGDATLPFLLADTLIRAGVEPGQPSFAEAVRLLKKSIELDPQFRKARVSLGKLYLRAAKPEEAARQFREAVRLDPKDRSALTQLVLLLRRTGKTREADTAVAELKRLMAEDTISSLSPR